ncbi:hypothetical protein RJ55_08225 [Drechmeria coniospora]|nr:hypothetical protein RJ55_08225 [Drechmeria coniospora]
MQARSITSSLHLDFDLSHSISTFHFPRPHAIIRLQLLLVRPSASSPIVLRRRLEARGKHEETLSTSL